MKSNILIAGATGATGRVATKLLLEQGFQVRALVRKEDERSEKLAVLGADIVVGDLLDFRSVRRAFNGAERAYFVYPMRPGIVQATAHFAQAAAEAKAEFVLNISQKTARSDAISDSALQHWLAERVFDRFATPVTHLHPTIFADWFLYMRRTIREGHWGVPFEASGKFAPIASEDQGAVIAAILAAPKEHEGKTYELLGPVELTAPQMAEIASRVLGRSIAYEQITPEQWVKDVTSQEIPFLAQHLAGIAVHQKMGFMGGTNDVVETITGHKAMTLEQYLEKHKAVFQ